MKKIVMLLLLSVSFSFAQGGFDQGNALYRKGDYAGAVTAYESVLKGKKHSAELYFNLANAHYKLNHIGPAIYNYEKALRLDPGDNEIKTNLKFAQKAAIDDVKEKPNVGFMQMIYNAAASFTPNNWGWMAVAFAFGCLLCFAGYYFSGTALAKRSFFIAMFACLFLVVAGTGAGFLAQKAKTDNRDAIVFDGVLQVKTEPKADAQDAFVLHEGTKVTVVDTLDNWRKVQLPDQAEGWVTSASIKEIK